MTDPRTEEPPVTDDRPRGRRARRRAVLLTPLFALLACAPEGVRDSTTDTAAPQAEAIDGLFWYSVLLGTAVWLVVLGLLAVPIVRSRRMRREERAATDEAAMSRSSDRGAPGDAPAATHDAVDGGGHAVAGVDVEAGARTVGLAGFGAGELPAAEVDEPLLTADRSYLGESDADRRVRNRLIWIGGIVVPAIILLSLLIYSSMVGRATAHVPEDGDLVIDVVGHMFWWEVHYPDLDITTANEIVVPTDQPVRLNLTTEDVIHSFWMPRLHGKVDMIPGRENIMTFTATQTGRFRGQCAEFCGVAHAQMVAFVDAVEPADYEAWVEGQQQPAGEPANAEGERIFLEVGCAACHAVDGLDGAQGRVGPDLTHLGTRGSLAAGIVPNTRENLGRLLVDPWGVKPGNPMPPTPLDDDELSALLDYLEGLGPEGTL